MKLSNPTQNLLFRFHFLVICINIIATCIDAYQKNYANSLIELLLTIFLGINIYFLQKYQNIKKSIYMFLFISSLALFSLIYVNHFATMSIVFVLLLPLSASVFLKLRETLAVMVVHIFTFSSLLYIEYSTNPQNPLIANQNALFNLGYTILIVYLFGIFYHIFIIKTFDELDSANRQKTMLLGEVHHRVKNNLNVIASILGLQAFNLSKEERTPLLETKSRIEAMSMVHEMLYKTDDIQKIHVYTYIENLSSQLLNLYNKKQISIHISTNDIRLPLQTMFQLGIIINELFTNSLKYAFNGEEGEICISLKKEQDRYFLFYKDDGKGVENMYDLTNNNSLGYKLIVLGIKQLQGNISVTNLKPLTYKMDFTHE
ncbi:MAG: hypothetical protein CR967_01280 [Proteobacteria bacterium]|nr:MAG: hypothetical protein CR967_01280 [Pseudomonadota bacterium]